MPSIKVLANQPIQKLFNVLAAFLEARRLPQTLV